MHCFHCVFFTMCFFTFFTSSRVFKPIAEAYWNFPKKRQIWDSKSWFWFFLPGCFKQTNRISRNSTSLYIYIISMPLVSRMVRFFHIASIWFIVVCKTPFLHHQKIVDRSQKWLFGKCIAFQICYGVWVFQSCTSFRAKKNAEKNMEKMRSPMFFRNGPRLSWGDWKTLQHLSISDGAKRRAMWV